MFPTREVDKSDKGVGSLIPPLRSSPSTFHLLVSSIDDFIRGYKVAIFFHLLD